MKLIKPLLQLFAIVLIALASLHTTAYGQESAFQRIAFDAVDVTLEAGAKSAPILSYCIDPVRESPELLSTYKTVHVDGNSAVKIGSAAPISLQKALQTGQIELKGNSYESFRFINKTGKRVSIKTQDISAVGDLPNDNVSLSEDILKEFKPDSKTSQYTNQDLIWAQRQRQEFFRQQGLIGDHPSRPQYQGAVKKLKEKYDLKSDADLDQFIGEKKSSAEYQESDTRTLKYLKRLNTDHPSFDELYKAKMAYRKELHLTSLAEVNELLGKESDLLNEKLAVFQESGELKDNPSTEEILQAEAAYRQKYGIADANAYNTRIEYDYYKIATAETSARSVLYRIKGGTEPIAISELQTAAGLPATGKLQHSPLKEVLNMYSNLARPNGRSLEFENAQGFIDQVTENKKALHLNPEFKPDDAAKTYLTKLNQVAKEQISSLYGGFQLKTDGDKILIASAGKAVFLNRSDLSVIKSVNISYTTVDKIDDEWFMVGGQITRVGDLTDAFDKASAYLKEKVSFGENMTKTDCQAVIRTRQIRSLATHPDETRLAAFTGATYDFSNAPVYRLKEGSLYGDELSVYIPKKAQPAAGAGIAGDLEVTVRDVSPSWIARLKARITTLFAKMRLHPEMNFASGLKADLRANHIPFGDVIMTMSHIEIVKVNRPAPQNPNEPQYGRNQNNNTPILFSWLQLPFIQRRFFAPAYRGA